MLRDHVLPSRRAVGRSRGRSTSAHGRRLLPWRAAPGNPDPDPDQSTIVGRVHGGSGQDGPVNEYEKDGAEIYRQSFAMIRATTDLSRFSPEEAQVAVRMIHSCGMVDLVDDIAFSPGAVLKARAALKSGAPILCDVQMVASGVTRRRLPADNEVLCTLSNPRVGALAREMANTRTAASVELWRDRLDSAVVAIGNAPTALFHLLDLLRDTDIRPAVVVGIPVGFIGAAESKQALVDNDLGLAYIVVHGRRGGSAITCGALNAIASEEE
jgi:precorrin-8X/cobalt-precorrin-8 methylmutase